ncbi:MAG: hypothetical protein HYX76_01525, partial [Acidobacteria bacterium]|nr:hypothetical protein [Acidobacteriota bacterium]
MRPLRVGPLVVALALATAVVVTAACSEGDATAARGSTTVGIEISPFFVTLENKAGLPLLDIRVAIEVAGRTTYTAFLGR